MRLTFNPDKLPRTMTRAQWHECYRWLRVVQRTVREHFEDAMMRAMLYGSVDVSP